MPIISIFDSKKLIMAKNIESEKPKKTEGRWTMELDNRYSELSDMFAITADKMSPEELTEFAKLQLLKQGILDQENKQKIAELEEEMKHQRKKKKHRSHQKVQESSSETDSATSETETSSSSEKDENSEEDTDVEEEESSSKDPEEVKIKKRCRNSLTRPSTKNSMD